MTISISTYLDVVNCEQGQIELKRSREDQFGMVASLCLILLTADDASIINSAEDIRPSWTRTFLAKAKFLLHPQLVCPF